MLNFYSSLIVQPGTPWLPEFQIKLCHNFECVGLDLERQQCIYKVKTTCHFYILFFMSASNLAVYFIRHKETELQAGFSEFKHLEKDTDANGYKFVLISIKDSFLLQTRISWILLYWKKFLQEEILVVEALQQNF